MNVIKMKRTRQSESESFLKKLTKLSFLSTLLLSLVLFLSLVTFVTATPTGAGISSNSTDTGPTSSTTGITNNRSTISTLILNASQQDQHWKAYIGNVSGSLSLEDSSRSAIYDWSLTTTTGEVFASNTSNLQFTTVACADASTISSMETKMNMTASDVDSLSSTFNSTDHTPTVVSGTSLSGCDMTSLYVNSASQGQNNAADFQEFLMKEGTSNLVFVSILNDNTVGYNGAQYDFQMIVPESDTQSASTYYFWLELG